LAACLRPKIFWSWRGPIQKQGSGRANPSRSYWLTHSVGKSRNLATPIPRDPNGGSVALGHPFAATGARILSQAIKELAAMSKESRAIVSICADGGLGTVALLEN